MFGRKKGGPGSDRHLVIIGNGIAGVTTARAVRARDKKCRITMVSGESLHFFSRPALMYIYMGHLTERDTRPFEDWFWKKARIERRQAWVKFIDVDAKRVDFADDSPSLEYDQLVIATGSKPNKFGWPGQDLARVQGMCSLQDLANLEAVTDQIEHGVVVGGGLIGVELAEMLHSRGKRVTLLAREKSYWNNALPEAEATLVGRVIRKGGIDLRLSTELDHIEDDGQGRACAVHTKDGERIACEFVGLTAGVSPNLSALEGSKIPTGRGVLCDLSLRTQVPDVYAAGDCVEFVTPEGQRNIVEQLWYTGEMHGEVLGRVLCGEEAAHDRGIWFNSAKFFDLEWHTYGEVPPSVGATPDLQTLYWQPEDADLAFRLVLRDGRLVGVNALGIRYRHKVCERWIADGLSAEQVLERLPEGNFDPEFFRRYEPAIVRSFREQLR